MSSSRGLAPAAFFNFKAPANIKKQQTGLICDDKADLSIYPIPLEFPNEQAPEFKADSKSEIRHELTFGDLHAHHLLMLYQLIRHGILSLPLEDYEKFKERFRDQEYLVDEERKEAKAIIEKIQTTSAKPLLRYVGDEFCDRAGNDDLIMQIYIKLAQFNIPFESLISNHSFHIIYQIEKFRAADKILQDQKNNDDKTNNVFCENDKFLSNPLRGFGPSIEELWKNIYLEADSEALDKLPTYKQVWEKMKAWVNNFVQYYIPRVKVFSYTLNENHQSICIYSHAPIDEKTILAAAVKLSIKKIGDKELKQFIKIENNCPLQDAQAIIDLINRDSYSTDEKEVTKNMDIAKNIKVEMTPSELAECIDAINAEFSKKAREGLLSELINSDPNTDQKSENINPILYPFFFTLWNRNYEILHRPSLKIINDKTYYYGYVHGHDSPAPENNNTLTLDNDLGKRRMHDSLLKAGTYFFHDGSFFVASYQALYTQHYPVPAPVPKLASIPAELTVPPAKKEIKLSPIPPALKTSVVGSTAQMAAKLSSAPELKLAPASFAATGVLEKAYIKPDSKSDPIMSKTASIKPGFFGWSDSTKVNSPRLLFMGEIMIGDAPSLSPTPFL